MLQTRREAKFDAELAANKAVVTNEVGLWLWVAMNVYVEVSQIATFHHPSKPYKYFHTHAPKKKKKALNTRIRVGGGSNFFFLQFFRYLFLVSTKKVKIKSEKQQSIHLFSLSAGKKKLMEINYKSIRILNTSSPSPSP